MSDKDKKPAFSLMRRHPVRAFLLLAFLISWGVILAVCLPTGIPGQGAALETLLVPIYLAMLAGPFLSALIMSIALDGRAGLVRLFRGFTIWRAKPVEYAVAFLLIPVCALATLLVLSLVSADFRPSVLVTNGGLSTSLLGIATGLVSGFAVALIEETGWTGFATPRLLLKHSVMAVGLGFGLIHGFWHYLVTVWSAGVEYGPYLIPFIFTLWTLALIVMRVLIVWIYARTESTLLAAVVHASHTGTLFAIWPPATSPMQDVIWTAAFGILGLAAVMMIASLSPPETNSIAPHPINPSYKH